MCKSCSGQKRFLLRRLRAMAPLFFGWLLIGPASSQIDPDDSGAGAKLGLAQLGNSGQVGTVTVLQQRARLILLLEVRSTPGEAVEPAHIRRGLRCKAAAAPHTPFLELSDVRGGVSRSEVRVAKTTLLSGNYLLEIFASRHSLRRVSCGELHN